MYNETIREEPAQNSVIDILGKKQLIWFFLMVRMGWVRMGWGKIRKRKLRGKSSKTFPDSIEELVRQRGKEWKIRRID